MLVLYTMAGFFLVPWVAERQLPVIAGDLLERPVSVKGVSFNPFMLSTEIRELRLQEKGGDDLVGFDSLYINFQLSSLFRRAWTFAEIRFERPSLELVRFEDGGINLLRLIPEQERQQEKSDAGPPRVIIGELSLDEGSLLYRDETRAGGFTVPVSPISFTFINISTLPEDDGEHRLAAQSEGGANLVWRGTAQLSPLQLEGEVTADGPYPALIARYFQDLLNVEVTDGQARLNLAYRVRQGDNGELSARIDPLQLALRDLTLAEKGGDTVFTLPEANLNDLKLHWPEQSLTLGNLSLGGASLELVRGADGQFNVRQWLADSDGAPPTADKADNGDGGPLGGWTLAVNSIRVQDLDLTFQDAALRKPGSVQIQDLNLDLGRITSDPGDEFPFKIDLSLASGGQIRFTGDATLLPSLLANGKYQIDKLALAGAQPWLSDFARARIDGGHLNMAGTIATSPESPFDITGELSLGQLDISATAGDEQLLSWQSLMVDHFAYSLGDNHLELSLLTLKEPFARILIDENQNTNIGDLLVERKADAGKSTSSQTEEETTEPAQPFSLVLSRASIEDGSVDFADLSLPIPFKTLITELGGGMDSTDTDSAEPATLKLEGQVNDYGLARIEGTLKPLEPAEQTDIQLVFRNIDFPDLSAYTIKFAGRRIADGRMDLDLGYQLDGGKLRGRNNIVINDLKLGEKVDYEGAADLPLGLAVALLKGPDGRIRIDLPVEGDVNNPSFDISKVIGNAIGNLITRAVTAPFRFLGSLVGGGGDEFGRLYFAPGSAELSPPEREKVAKLAQALAQRPALGLRVAPVMAPPRDRQALKRMITDASIEAAIGDSKDADQSFTDRRRQALEHLFQARFSAEALAEVRDASRKPEDPEKPDGRQLLDNTRYLSALRDRLIEAQEVSDARLEGLARQRADTLVSLLTGEEGIDRLRARVAAVKTVEVSEENRVPLELEVESLE